MKKPDYSKITRTDGSWLRTYMRGCENVETNESYDFWTGMWLASNVVGRKLSVLRPQAPVFLNLYVVLCAESGITRKSSAVRRAVDILTAYDRRYKPGMSIFSGGTTAEGLDRELMLASAEHRHAHAAIASTELVTLLGKERYNASLPGRLTDLYDCPSLYTRQSATHGRLDARNVYPTLLGASTPSWLVRAINPDVVEGGFTSRCIFAIEDKPKRLIAWPEVNAVDDELLLTRLGHLRDQRDYVLSRVGGINLSPTAKQEFKEWYERRKLVNDPYGASFQAREDHHVLRIAGLLCASDDSWEIDVHHIQHAIQLVAYVRALGASLFGTGVASSRTYAIVDRIRSALVEAGTSGLSQSHLSTICRKLGGPTDVREVLRIMHEMNLVQKFVIQDGSVGGAPTTIYRATKAIVSSRALEDVVDTINPPEE